MLWIVAWLLLLVLVVATWATYGVMRVNKRFGVRAIQERSISLWGHLCDKRLIGAWVLLLALASLPASRVWNLSWSAGTLVAVSFGVGAFAGFVASAFAYLRLPAAARKG